MSPATIPVSRNRDILGNGYSTVLDKKTRYRLLRARYPRFAVWEAHIGRGILIIVVGGFVIGLIVNNHWLSR